jgi:hypothetical protein
MILYYKTMSKYNIIINSNSRILDGNANSSNYQYTFDWSLIPEGQYHLSFSFVSSETVDHDTIAISLPDLGVSRNIYITQLSTSQSSSSIIGFARSVVTSDTTSIYFASAIDNPSIFVNSTPKSNTFSVILLDAQTDVPYDISASYKLTISLNSID